jgi:hypothetical protein
MRLVAAGVAMSALALAACGGGNDTLYIPPPAAARACEAMGGSWGQKWTTTQKEPE